MGKYRRYRNRLEMFLQSDRGKRALNIVYSWGASIVIIGALFKILHLPYANQILFIAMMVESFVFFVSGFDHPFSEYHWEDVFPVLKSKNPMDRPDFTKGSGVPGMNTDDANAQNNNANIVDEAVSEINSSASQRGGFSGGGFSGGGNAGGGGGISGGSGAAGGGNVSGGASVSGGGSLNIAGNIDVTEEDTKTLSESIKKLSDAAEQISKMSELTEATQQYLQQISGMSESMSKFSEVTASLTDVSDTLLTSYRSITDNSDGINSNSRGYVQQMELLNRNISGLNTIYEIQLKGVSSQIDAIDHINAGLQRIREMYDGSVSDSSVFRNETEKMTRQLSELNNVYTRLLQAMTVNMNIQNVAQQTPPQPNYQQPNYQQPNYRQPDYPQQPYKQQPPYDYRQEPPYNNPVK